MKKKVTLHSCIQIIFFLILIGVDQWTKYLALIHLKGQEAVSLIPNVLEFRYLENAGAAFSMFQNKQFMFYIITAIVLIVVFGLWGRVVLSLNKYSALEGDAEKFRLKTYKNGVFLNYILMLLAAGAIGNLIDRIRLHYVIDYIYVRLINFPIFNFADICVTIAAVLIVVFFLFIYKDDKNFKIFGKKND